MKQLFPRMWAGVLTMVVGFLPACSAQNEGGSENTEASERSGSANPNACEKLLCNAEHDQCMAFARGDRDACGKDCAGTVDILGCLEGCSSLQDSAFTACRRELDVCSNSEKALECSTGAPGPGTCTGKTSVVCSTLGTSSCEQIKGCLLKSFLDGDVWLCTGAPEPCEAMTDADGCRSHRCTWK
jgi:hypothetical protein